MYRIQFQTGYFIIFFIHLDLLHLHMHGMTQASRKAKWGKALASRKAALCPQFACFFFRSLLLCFFCAFYSGKMLLFIWLNTMATWTTGERVALIPLIHLKSRAGNVVPLAKDPNSQYIFEGFLLLLAWFFFFGGSFCFCSNKTKNEK